MKPAHRYEIILMVSEKYGITYAEAEQMIADMFAHLVNPSPSQEGL